MRSVSILKSNSQGFKVTGSINVPLAPATGQVVYTNDFPKPHCPGIDCGSPGIIVPKNQYLKNTNGLEFFQLSGNTVVPWKGSARRTSSR